MKKLLLGAALLASTALPSIALAQPVPAPASALPFAGAVGAPTTNPATTGRLVVTYKNSAPATWELSERAERAMKAVRSSDGGRVQVLALEKRVPVYEAQAVAARLREDPRVESVELDVWVRPTQADTFASQQWALAPALAPNGGGANFLASRAKAMGAGVTVGVVDTGSVPHPDMAGQEIGGYDFISDGGLSGDNDLRDPDPSDTGDFCDASPSSWHGLKVASQIAALTENGLGIAGAAPSVRVVHARALGRCGGYLTDVADALAWSAGESVSGVPDNPNPAKVVNLSLSANAQMACPAYMQTAVNKAIARGAIVVAAAGNSAGEWLGTPANCAGVISVGAHQRDGDLANYSNYASSLSITAPGGGGCKTLDAGSCDSTLTIALGNDGTTVPGAPLNGVYFNGTSSAAPHVAAAAALLASLEPGITSAQVLSVLQSTARAHPAGTFCALNSTKCGAGMLDAAAAVDALGVPTLSVTRSYEGDTVGGNTQVSLTLNANSLYGIQSYQWTQLSGTTVSITDPTSPVLSFTTPGLREELVFEAKATDTNGGEARLQVVVKVNNLPVVQTEKVTGEQGKTLSFNLAVTDADGDALTYSLLRGPGGIQMSAQGAFLWTPKYGGTYEVTVRVYDGPDAKGVTHKFYIEVAGEPEPGGAIHNPLGGGGSSDLVFLGMLGAVVLGAYRSRRKAQAEDQA